MTTHNIGFKEDLTKIIFQISSNFLKFIWICTVQITSGIHVILEPRCEKTGLRHFRPELTQTRLSNYRICLDA